MEGVSELRCCPVFQIRHSTFFIRNLQFEVPTLNY